MTSKPYPRLTAKEIDRIRKDRTPKYRDLKSKAEKRVAENNNLLFMTLCWLVAPASALMVYHYSIYPIPALLLWFFLFMLVIERVLISLRSRSIKALIRENPQLLSPARLCVYCGHEFDPEPPMTQCPECGKERWRLGDFT